MCPLAQIEKQFGGLQAYRRTYTETHTYYAWHCMLAKGPSHRVTAYCIGFLAKQNMIRWPLAFCLYLLIRRLRIPCEERLVVLPTEERNTGNAMFCSLFISRISCLVAGFSSRRAASTGSNMKFVSSGDESSGLRILSTQYSIVRMV